MGIDQAGIGLPHDFLKLPELSKEAGLDIVDLLNVWAKLGVLVLLDIPERVGERTATGASHLLLPRCPVWEFYFVREQHAASQHMYKLELGLDGAKPLLSQSTT